MSYSSSLSNREWELIEPLLPTKKERARQNGVSALSLMGFSIASRMAAIGLTCPKTYRPIQRYFGISSNDERTG